MHHVSVTLTGLRGFLRRESRKGKVKLRYRNRAFLQLEQLGDRIVPAPYTVDTLGDLPDMNVGDGLAKDANNQTSLRAAIMEGNAQEQAVDPNVSINFQAGLSGTITLATRLDPLIRNFTITGPGASILTVERSGAPGTPNFRIFEIGVFTTSHILGLTISGGSAASGAGIWNGGNLTVTSCNITNNHATNTGGGISSAAAGTVTVSGCHIYLNTAGTLGGGIYYDGPQLIVGLASHIYANTARLGGGINTFSGNTSIREMSQIYGNSALAGGGIYTAGTLTMDGGQLVANSVATAGGLPGQGGGIYVEPAGNVTFTGVRIERNTASGNGSQGGGFYLRTNATLRLLQMCTLTGNTAPVGPGGAKQNPSTYQVLGSPGVTDQVTDL